VGSTLTAIAFDCETIPFVQGNHIPPLVGVGFMQRSLGAPATSDDAEPRLYAGQDGVREFLKVLPRDDVVFVGHNIPYDFAVMVREAGQYGYDEQALLKRVFDLYAAGRVVDTNIQERLALVRLGKLKKRRNDLASTVDRHFGKAAAAPLKKGKKDAAAIRLRYGQLHGQLLSTWGQEFKDYLEGDVRWTMAVYLKQVTEGLSPDIYEMSAAGWALHLMSAWGTRTDPARVAFVKQELEAEYAEHLEVLKPTGLIRPDGTQDMAATRARVEAAYAAMGKTPALTKKSKKTSTDAKCLRKSKDPTLVRLGQSQKSKTLLRTFIPTLEMGGHAPLNTFFQTTVDSGRTSSSKPNVQNISKGGGIRECFIPRPGWVFVGADYDTLEMRTLTQVVEDWFGPSRMGDALRAGFDLHLLFAAEQLLKIPYAEALRRRAAGDAAVEEARDFAKVANFGFPGGLGPASMSSYAEGYGLVISEAEAYTLREQWYAQWPEMKLYFGRIRDMAADPRRHDGRFVFDDGSSTSTFWIDQHLIGRRRGGCFYTSACNTFFQGLAADGAKRALFMVSYECYCVPSSPLYGCRPVLFVHDEIVMEAPPSADLTAAAARLVEVMVKGMASLVTCVPVTAGPVAMMRWSKKAKEIRDPQGRLVPWEEAISPMQAAARAQVVTFLEPA